MPAGGIPVGADHHALSGSQSVILDDPRALACGRPEPVQGRVQTGGIGDGLTGCSSYPGGGHHVFGEGLGALDAGSVRRRAEAGDPGRPYGIRHATDQGHLGADDDQAGLEAGGQSGDLLRGGDIDVALGGHRSGPRVAGRYGQEVDGRVVA